jgi:hypothetical protein
VGNGVMKRRVLNSLMVNECVGDNALVDDLPEPWE